MKCSTELDKGFERSQEQLPLPFDDRPLHEVNWIHGTTEKQRHWLFGRKTVNHLITELDGITLAKTRIAAKDVHRIKDPLLRYALAYQDAAAAAGTYHHTEYLSSSHYVSVVATNEGFDSKLISATYTGTDKDGSDTFIENLQRFAPDYDGHYDSL